MEDNQNQLAIYELLEQTASLYGQNEAIYDQFARLTYGELKQNVDQLAGVLKEKGIQKGDRIAVALPNWHETLVIFFAAAKIGAVTVPFNPLYKSHEILYIIKNTAPKLLFVTDQFEQNVSVNEMLAVVNEVVSVRFTHPSMSSYEEWKTEKVTVQPSVSIDSAEGIFCILHTSGTTGTPKGVMMTHRGVVQSGTTIAGELLCTNQDVFLVAVPVFHIFGMTCSLFPAISTGCKLVLKEKFHPREMLALIEQERVTIQPGVPTMFLKEIEVDNIADYDLTTLRAGVVGAAPVPANKVQEVREKLGMNLCQSYGSSETASVTMTPYSDTEEKITSTIGRAIPGVELKIVDEYRKELPIGERGEIAIKSFAMMKGYYKMPEQTARVLDHEGWFYTGDLGMLDADGYLYFTGRQKEMIIRGGYNIHPQEIESVLSKHSSVVEAVAIGLPDEVLGEIVCAVVQMKEGCSCTEEEIKQFVKQQLAVYKVPEKIIFTESFPMTPSGKIQKLKLREKLSAQVDSSAC